jgi:hypothetical protein
MKTSPEMVIGRKSVNTTYPAETATDNEFWYGNDDLWTMLPVDGAWRELPYHEDKDRKPPTPTPRISYP